MRQTISQVTARECSSVLRTPADFPFVVIVSKLPDGCALLFDLFNLHRRRRPLRRSRPGASTDSTDELEGCGGDK